MEIPVSTARHHEKDGRDCICASECRIHDLENRSLTTTDNKTLVAIFYSYKYSETILEINRQNNKTLKKQTFKRNLAIQFLQQQYLTTIFLSRNDVPRLAHILTLLSTTCPQTSHQGCKASDKSLALIQRLILTYQRSFLALISWRKLVD